MAELGAQGAPLEATIDRSSPRRPVVSLAGELDLSNVGALEQLIAPLLDGGSHGLVFDVCGLTFMDSSGIALLLRTAARLPQVTLRQPPEIIRRVLDSTGVSLVLNIEP